MRKAVGRQFFSRRAEISVHCREFSIHVAVARVALAARIFLVRLAIAATARKG
jgi:hypothetical protein